MSRPSQLRLDPGTSLLILIGLVLLVFVSWSLLIPDPYAIVRNTSLAWLEQVSDVFQHLAAFTLLSGIWLAVVQRHTGSLPPVILFTMLAYCLAMEGLQALVPGRHCGPRDALANVAGFVFGLAIVRLTAAVRLRHNVMVRVSRDATR